MSARRLTIDDAGAAMVFGLFFAVFLLGMLWYLSGLSDTLLYRQRLQDAADSAAFSAAVVNARGMNLIALINMTMAAVLSVLVGLRLAETLGLVAVGICAGLAWLSGGTTMAAVPPLMKAVRQVHEVADRVEKLLPTLLSPLHMAGKAVSVVVPVGSNLRVIDLVVHEYEDAKFGLAIPARLTLPVEDAEFDVLCKHAGQLAGGLAILPLMPILPSRVEAGVREIAGNIAAAGPDWFCGGEGERPDLNGEEDSSILEYPIMPKQRACSELAERGAKQGGDDPDAQAALERTCKEAAVEYLASLHNRAGQCRREQPVCPIDCEASTRRSCPPAYLKDCTVDEAAEYAALATELLGSDNVRCAPRTQDGRFDYTVPQRFGPYERRLMAAREQCDPSVDANRRKRGHAWLEREVIYTSVHDPKLGWVRDPEATEYGDARLVEQGNDGSAKPCEDLRDATRYESKDLRLPACQGDRRCLTPQYTDPYDYDSPCAQPKAITKGWPLLQREQVRQVTDVLRCVEERDLTQHAVERMDVTESLEESKKNGKGNTSPFRLERGLWLGGSDFQLRAVVVGKSLPSAGQSVIELSTWGQGDANTPDAFVADKIGRLGRLAFAQAEYYFDWAGLNPAPNDPLDEEDVSEWLWHMAWRARLRPFRLNHSKADAPKGKEAGPDAEQRALLPENLPEPDGLACERVRSDAEASCNDARAGMKLFEEGGP